MVGEGMKFDGFGGVRGAEIGVALGRGNRETFGGGSMRGGGVDEGIGRLGGGVGERVGWGGSTLW